MPFIMCYTKPGIGTYPDFNYPGHIGLNCDWEHAMHLAWSEDGVHYHPLRNDTGILFPKCTFTEGNPKGTTKTLLDPWLVRAADGSFVVLAVRRNQNAPDPLSVGSIMLFTSRDLVRYRETGFLRVAEGEIRHPRARYDADRQAYRVEWQTGDDWFGGYTVDGQTVTGIAACAPSMAPAAPIAADCVPGNALEITEAELKTLRAYLDEIRCVGVEPVSQTLRAGDTPALPKAVCRYSDGSTHAKPVDWDLTGVDLTKPGEYTVPGRIRIKRWRFPIPLTFGDKYEVEFKGMSDPCMTEYHGRYFLSSSGSNHIMLRIGHSMEEAFAAAPTVIHELELPEGMRFAGTWAAELHEIDGVPYLFTTICPDGEWTLVKSVVLRCHGDPADPSAWEKPRYCVKPDGSLLTEGGISLDMTHFRDHGLDYVMWSDRKLHYDVTPPLPEPADIYIATVDPKAPWKLTSEPRCVIRPMYGWDRYETEVDEGPYLLRRGDDLFVTISGSSTGMGDLYDVGLLHAKAGTDLLDAANWDWLPYPLLTKESVPGEYGPGHNNFLKDPETGDDLMVYHAIPHDKQDKALGRQPGVRRVHWAATGLPYLEMTPERDLPEGMERIAMKLTVMASIPEEHTSDPRLQRR